MTEKDMEIQQLRRQVEDLKQQLMELRMQRVNCVELPCQVGDDIVIDFDDFGDVCIIRKRKDI